MCEQEPSVEFCNAAEHVRNMKDLDQPLMLRFYGLYKQATVGKCNISKPSFWDLVGKSKWESWKKLGDMSNKAAAIEYIKLVMELDPVWDGISNDKLEDSNKSSGMGPAVSIMCHSEEEIISDENKTVFDWCKEGNCKEVTKFASRKGFDVNSKDENGMSLLHWSCDRGYKQLVEIMIKQNANVNLQDLDLQTPLHYATVCEHEEIVRMLLDAGADATLKDDAGLTASESTYSKHIKEIISSKLSKSLVI